MRLSWIGTLVAIGAGVVLGIGALHGWAQTPQTPQPPKAETNKADKAGQYDQAIWNKFHFLPPGTHVTDEQCLTCHQEVLERRVLPKSPAGLKASDVLAWYQTLDTYTGEQETFHRRHLVTPYAKSVMNLSCNFCHGGGHDPREEAPGASATGAAQATAGFTLRKVVDVNKTCLLCHGSFPSQIMGLPGPWHQTREGLESGDVKNGCLICHAEQFRTNRHKVTYLNGAKIEELGKESSDVCYGCHGGRSWYRISYPYPRHPWPGMSPDVPDWAKGRPTQSDPEYRIEDGATEQDE